MKPRLLPCPFCGGPAEMKAERCGEDCMETWVRCKDCGVATDRYEGAYSDPESAAAAWNERAPASEPHQSEGTGSDARDMAIVTWARDLIIETAKRFDLGRSSVDALWLATQIIQHDRRSRTEREAGERVIEGWVVGHHVGYGGCPTFFEDKSWISDPSVEPHCVPATLILRAPAPRVPANEGGNDG